MKAIVYSEYGPPEVLKLRDVPQPVPGAREILVRIHAATVIAADCEFRSFSFPLWFWLPLRIYAGLLRPKRVNILGQELAGEVEAVGESVTRFKKGDHVFAATEIGLGAHAEYKCISDGKPIALKPAGISFEEAAVIPTGGLNALHYLRKGSVRKGDQLLINGAGGNIGSFAVQLAKHFGAEVTAVDCADKLDLLRSLGADHVIDYACEDFTQNGAEYDVIFDVIGKSPFSRSVRSLKPGGRYVLANPRVHSMLRGLWTSATSSKQVLFEFASYRSEDLSFLAELIEGGELKSVIDRSFPLGEIAEAHRLVDQKRHHGNVVIQVRD